MSAAALAFLGDKLDVDQLAELAIARCLRLVPHARGARGVATLNGDPDLLVDELLRLARLGLMVGVAAADAPTRAVGDVVEEAERKLRTGR